MTGLRITGIGAVSPAGWNVASLADAVQQGVPLPVTEVAREPRPTRLQVRHVPPPAARPPWLAHPRLRRASAISHAAVSAALEALKLTTVPTDCGSGRLGVVVSVMTGSVVYSRRFFEEVLRNPSTASPLIFPETVFNAPASHLAAVLGGDGLNYTLVGDGSAYLEGLAIAAGWLMAGDVDRALVVGVEETDWLTAEAWALFDRAVPATGGAGALLLERDTGPAEPRHPTLRAVTDGFRFANLSQRHQAIANVRSALTAMSPEPAPAGALLVDGCSGSRRYDATEQTVWSDWPGLRSSPKRVLGEGFAAAAAWQCVLAVHALREGFAPEARVSVAGLNMAAAAASFRR